MAHDHLADHAWFLSGAIRSGTGRATKREENHKLCLLLGHGCTLKRQLLGVERVGRNSEAYCAVLLK